MRDPRYQVRSVHGYGSGRHTRKPHRTFYVMDSAYCWEIVDSFTDEGLAKFRAEQLNLRWRMEQIKAEGQRAMADGEPERKPRKGVSFRRWNARRHKERNGT